MNREDLLRRTKRFSLEIICLVEGLPKSRISDVLGHQLLRAGTSVGAHYRAACRARSRTDFIAKLGIVKEEMDETRCWLELLAERGLLSAEILAPLTPLPAAPFLLFRTPQ